MGHLAFGLSTGMMVTRELLSEVDPTQTGDTKFLENTPTVIMPNAGLGMYYYTDKMYVGFSSPRLLTNKFSQINAYKVDNKFAGKDLHYYVSGGYVQTLDNGIKIKPSAMLKVVYGAPVETDLSLQALFKDCLWVGASWRSGDAVSFLATFYASPKLRIGYSYDYSFTAIRNVTSGSHEICIGYDITFDKQKVVSPRLF